MVRNVGSRILGSLRRNWRVAVVAVCVMAFVWLLQEVNEGEILRLDSLAYSVFVAYLRSDALTPVMESLSNLADPVTLLVMLVIVAAFAPGRRPGICATLNLGLVIILNQLIKGIIQRPRPDGFRLVAESGYSFPSGHSMVAMAFFGLLAWLVWHYEKDRVLRGTLCAFFAVLIVAIGVSRIYLGVHYASDVIAGFCVSMAWLAFYTKAICPLLLSEEGDGQGGGDARRDPSRDGTGRG
ncbi:MAG: phosphatase PAP2 family protein [Atopobiaceae bacterium]|jgi:undecaprenyl-diphosphatase|nr:phosphatase PAP2 family protein [Atopobiaceae bacterium]